MTEIPMTPDIHEQVGHEERSDLVPSRRNRDENGLKDEGNQDNEVKNKKRLADLHKNVRLLVGRLGKTKGGQFSVDFEGKPIIINLDNVSNEGCDISVVSAEDQHILHDFRISTSRLDKNLMVQSAGYSYQESQGTSMSTGDAVTGEDRSVILKKNSEGSPNFSAKDLEELQGFGQVESLISSIIKSD